jgi:hypothetical protein
MTRTVVERALDVLLHPGASVAVPVSPAAMTLRSRVLPRKRRCTVDAGHANRRPPPRA